MGYRGAMLGCLPMVIACGSAENNGNFVLLESDPAVTEYSLISCEDDLSDMLALINAQRAQTQVCGGELFQAATELSWNSALNQAAALHSANMANYDFFSHTGIDQKTVSDRVTDQGYSWSVVAENIAAGQSSAQQVVDDWMLSDDHCRNIMRVTVSEMGLACVTNSDSRYLRYWTQVLASPL